MGLGRLRMPRSRGVLQTMLRSSNFILNIMGSHEKIYILERSLWLLSRERTGEEQAEGRRPIGKLLEKPRKGTMVTRTGVVTMVI